MTFGLGARLLPTEVAALRARRPLAPRRVCAEGSARCGDVAAQPHHLEAALCWHPATSPAPLGDRNCGTRLDGLAQRRATSLVLDPRSGRLACNPSRVPPIFPALRPPAPQTSGAHTRGFGNLREHRTAIPLPRGFRPIPGQSACGEVWGGPEEAATAGARRTLQRAAATLGTRGRAFLLAAARTVIAVRGSRPAHRRGCPL